MKKRSFPGMRLFFGLAKPLHLPLFLRPTLLLQQFHRYRLWCTKIFTGPLGISLSIFVFALLISFFWFDVLRKSSLALLEKWAINMYIIYLPAILLLRESDLNIICFFGTHAL